MPKPQSCESRLRAESRDIALRMVRAIRPGRNEHPEHRGVFSAEEEYEEVPTRVIRGVARIAGANIKYTREAPLHEEDIKDPIPALIAHGWGGPELAYQELREEIAKRGKPAITYNSPRSMGWRNDLNPVHLFQVSKFSSQAAWGVIREVMTEHGDELVDAYGHSLGGQTAVNVTIHKPEHVRGVILDGSCGLDFHTLQEMISIIYLGIRHGPLPKAWTLVPPTFIGDFINLASLVNLEPLFSRLAIYTFLSLQ
jgi:pimeloyl-ACP methyl ester carboxylesterase